MPPCRVIWCGMVARDGATLCAVHAKWPPLDRESAEQWRERMASMERARRAAQRRLVEGNGKE